jgi:GMP synthase PP-ATPase subunit
MNRKDLLKDMKDSIGTKDPIEFFDKMVDAFDLLFQEIDQLKKKLDTQNTISGLSIQWDPKVAATMLANQIEVLRKDKDIYHQELSALKVAYVEDKVTQDYKTFCTFWEDTLGYHPFLNYEK